MDRQEFLEQMQDVMQTETELNFDTKLEDLEEWDSLAAMATIAFLDQNFKVRITYKDIPLLKTIEDIAKKAGV